MPVSTYHKFNNESRKISLLGSLYTTLMNTILYCFILYINTVAAYLFQNKCLRIKTEIFFAVFMNIYFSSFDIAKCFMLFNLDVFQN